MPVSKNPSGRRDEKGHELQSLSRSGRDELTSGLSGIAEKDKGNLASLGDKIVLGHRRVTLMLTASAVAALETGMAALEAKQLLGHGEFLPWVDEQLTSEFGISRRTVQRYMQLAKNRDVLLNRIASVYCGDISKKMKLEHAEQILLSMGLQDAVSLLSPRAVSSDPNGRAASRHSLELLTPPEVIHCVRTFFDERIDLDPCAESAVQPNVPADRHYRREDDGLRCENAWRGNVFLHPPSGRQTRDWVARAVTEHTTENVNEAVLLLPAEKDADWMPLLDAHVRLLVRAGLEFRAANQSNGAPVKCASLIVGLIAPQRVEAFAQSFRGLGVLFVPYHFLQTEEGSL